jgi:hypothetical protein
MGGVVGDQFVVVSGYSRSIYNATRIVYAYDTKNSSAQWRRMDDLPFVDGLTHMSFAKRGGMLYTCGGYIGATPGPETNLCLSFNHSQPPTKQWTILPPLPEGRGGGSLWVIRNSNSLVFSAGAIRPNRVPMDRNSTWELNLGNLRSGWIPRESTPLMGNHISHATITYPSSQRFFLFGGQKGFDEGYGNQADMFEWDQFNRTWIRRASMPFARGHATASTPHFGCGIVVAGGVINGKYNGTYLLTETSDVQYYNANLDVWTKMGDLPEAIRAPICDIVRFPGGVAWLYCQGGRVARDFSWRIRITM